MTQLSSGYAAGSRIDSLGFHVIRLNKSGSCLAKPISCGKTCIKHVGLLTGLRACTSDQRVIPTRNCSRR
jgi:hypothetical protein